MLIQSGIGVNEQSQGRGKRWFETRGYRCTFGPDLMDRPETRKKARSRHDTARNILVSGLGRGRGP
jgi:hypothetical protein